MIEYNFGNQCANCDDWYVVVDGVMGGKSQGVIAYTDTSIVFSGNVSLENNGGFTSIRTKEHNFDLSKYSTVVIKYKSIGQDFSFYLNRYKKHYEPKFRIDLPITNNLWKEEVIALKDFKIVKLGKEINGNITREDFESIIKIGFISNTKTATEFSLELDYVKFE